VHRVRPTLGSAARSPSVVDGGPCVRSESTSEERSDDGFKDRGDRCHSPIVPSRYGGTRAFAHSYFITRNPRRESSGESTIPASPGEPVAEMVDAVSKG
jgi:hypothetical protein